MADYHLIGWILQRVPLDENRWRRLLFQPRYHVTVVNERVVNRILERLVNPTVLIVGERWNVNRDLPNVHVPIHTVRTESASTPLAEVLALIRRLMIAEFSFRMSLFEEKHPLMRRRAILGNGLKGIDEECVRRVKNLTHTLIEYSAELKVLNGIITAAIGSHVLPPEMPPLTRTGPAGSEHLPWPL